MTWLLTRRLVEVAGHHTLTVINITGVSGEAQTCSQSYGLENRTLWGGPQLVPYLGLVVLPF